MFARLNGIPIFATRGTRLHVEIIHVAENTRQICRWVIGRATQYTARRSYSQLRLVVANFERSLRNTDAVILRRRDKKLVSRIDEYNSKRQ